MIRIRETLLKQLELLAEHSLKADSATLISLTQEMINLSQILSPEFQSQSADAVPYLFLGRLSTSDFEELVQVRRERLRQQEAEMRQFYKDLESQ